MKRRRSPFYPVLALAATVVLSISGCDFGGLIDPYADPVGATPPATITDPTISTSGSIAPKAGTTDLLNINVAGFADPATGTLPNLAESAFTVVEDGTVKGITVERIGGSVTAPADIVFVFDTTGSMGSALTSVQDSILDFVDDVQSRGLDVRVGAVTFGDAYDTKSAAGTRGTSIRDDTPPSFDTAERPTFLLSNDFTAFETFITGDSPRGGGDGAENALGALEFAYDSMNWRAGAQKIMIVIMDIYSHNDETYAVSWDDAWQPSTETSVLNKLRGNATVHVVAPEYPSGAGAFTDMAIFAGVTGTGGEFFAWSGGTFDLTDLPIATVSGGYVVTFRGTIDGTEHTVRVVINDGGIRGEFTITPTY